MTVVNDVKTISEVRENKQNNLSEDHLAILKTLVYSGLFEYPLTINELYYFVMGRSMSKRQFNILLQELIPQYISKTENYFTVPGNESIIKKRLSRLSISEKKWFQAFKIINILSHFPFILMIAVTGSLVFNNIRDTSDDIDLFIIVNKHHLWKTRFLVYSLVRFLRLFKIELCPNYMITNKNLELSDQNFYSARELKEMVPVFGENLFDKIILANPWANNYYPNATYKNQYKFKIIKHETTYFRNIFEKILSTKAFSFFEKFEMNRQIKGLKKLSTNMSEMDLSTDCCKSHVSGHGNWIKEKFEANIKTLYNYAKE